MNTEIVEGFTFDKIYESVRWFEMPKIKPSGTTSVVLEFGIYKITLIKNEMMGDGYAILSPDVYEKIYDYFRNLNKGKEDEVK